MLKVGILAAMSAMAAGGGGGGGGGGGSLDTASFPKSQQFLLRNQQVCFASQGTPQKFSVLQRGCRCELGSGTSKKLNEAKTIGRRTRIISPINMKKEEDPGVFTKLIDENTSIAVGVFSISVLLVNRLFTSDLSNAQSRVDLLGIAVASALLVSALSTLDLEVREKETVKLAGVWFEELPKLLDKRRESLLLWSLQTILQVVSLSPWPPLMLRQVCSNAQSVIIGKGQQDMIVLTGSA
mmetsp:Transcript_5427/g.19095  ORF Transcript_5427/g.19095 Transcript_5427/m.19095 type:complete len:239 (-) Transcript_5427:2389-3105(-)